MQHGRTEKTEDVVKKGDRVKVKLIDRDERGRLRLSMKALFRSRKACRKIELPRGRDGVARASRETSVVGDAASGGRERTGRASVATRR